MFVVDSLCRKKEEFVVSAFFDLITMITRWNDFQIVERRGNFKQRSHYSFRRDHECDKIF